MADLNASEVRKINKRNILRYVLKEKTTTKPAIAAALGLSVPTVGQLVGELSQEGLLEAAGTVASSGGRRAAQIAPVKSARSAVGVDITKQHISFVIVNLAGETVVYERMRRPFEDKPEYYAFMTEYCRELYQANGIPEESVLGVGISVQGLVSPDQKYFNTHMVEGRRTISTYDFGNARPHIFLNDGTASCMSEFFYDNSPDDFIYLMLSRTVGGGLVHNRKLLEGVNLHAGEFGHMVLHSGRQEMCYCGRRGHSWCYSSVETLESFCGGNYHLFFKHLQQREPEYVQRFDTYLDDLALMVCNLMMFYDSTVILGGYVGAYLEPYMPYIRSKVAEMNHTYIESKSEVLLGRHSVDAAGVGAARYFMEKFLNEL